MLNRVQYIIARKILYNLKNVDFFVNHQHATSCVRGYKMRFTVVL